MTLVTRHCDSQREAVNIEDVSSRRWYKEFAKEVRGPTAGREHVHAERVQCRAAVPNAEVAQANVRVALYDRGDCARQGRRAHGKSVKWTMCHEVVLLRGATRSERSSGRTGACVQGGVIQSRSRPSVILAVRHRHRPCRPRWRMQSHSARANSIDKRSIDVDRPVRRERALSSQVSSTCCLRARRTLCVLRSACLARTHLTLGVPGNSDVIRYAGSASPRPTPPQLRKPPEIRILRDPLAPMLERQRRVPGVGNQIADRVRLAD